VKPDIWPENVARDVDRIAGREREEEPGVAELFLRVIEDALVRDPVGAERLELAALADDHIQRTAAQGCGGGRGPSEQRAERDGEQCGG
jgi:hypothetical protein